MQEIYFKGDYYLLSKKYDCNQNRLHGDNRLGIIIAYPRKTVLSIVSVCTKKNLPKTFDFPAANGLKSFAGSKWNVAGANTLLCVLDEPNTVWPAESTKYQQNSSICYPYSWKVLTFSYTLCLLVAAEKVKCQVIWMTLLLLWIYRLNLAFEITVGASE